MVLPLAVAVLSFLAFWPTLDNGLVDIDDLALLVEETRYRGLNAENIAWMFRATNLGHWQPLTWLSYAIDWEMAGGSEDPRDFQRAVVAFHRTSMLLHAANAGLLSLAVFRLLAAAGLGAGVWVRVAAAVGALLWAVHPLRVESVSWATERRDVLSVFFLLLSVLAYLRAFPPESTRPASVRPYIYSILLLAVSLLAKPWGMTFFVVATIIDWYPLRRLPRNPLEVLRRRDFWPVLWQKIPYVVLGLASARMATWAIHSIQAMRTLDDWPLQSRIVQAFYGLVWYPARTLWPTKLSPLYELRHGLNPWEPQYLACYAVVIGIGLLLLAFYKRVPALVAAASAYAVCIAPVLGLTQSGDQFVADRYAYLATISLFVLAAGGLAWGLNRLPEKRRVLAMAPALGLAVVAAALTWEQTKAWRDSVTLWGTAVRKEPRRMMAQINYAMNIQNEGRTAEAIEHLRIATKLGPKDGRPWYALAQLLKKTGDLQGAEAAYRESAKYLPQAYMPLVNLGNLLRDTGRPDEALEAYKAAVHAVEHPRPGSVPSGMPYLSLGVALKARGDIEGAREAFLKALLFAEEEAKRKSTSAAPMSNMLRDQAMAHLRTLPPVPGR